MPKINNRDKRKILEYLMSEEVSTAIINKEEMAKKIFNKMSQKKKARLAREL